MVTSSARRAALSAAAATLARSWDQLSETLIAIGGFDVLSAEVLRPVGQADCLPWQRFVIAALAPRVEVAGQALITQRLLESADRRVARCLAGGQDGRRLATVAARERGLDGCPARAVAAHVDAFRPEVGAQVGQLLLQRRRRGLDGPLHRRLRFGHEAADVEHELSAAPASLGREALFDEGGLIDQRVQVLACLA